MKMTELQKKKLASRRFWIVIWACFILSFWGTVSLFAGITHPWMGIAFPIIAGIPASYVTITSLKKKERV